MSIDRNKLTSYLGNAVQLTLVNGEIQTGVLMEVRAKDVTLDPVYPPADPRTAPYSRSVDLGRIRSFKLLR